MIKKGSHLDGVEPINEKNIEKSIVLEILYKKIGEYKEAYKYILNIIEDKLIYDKSGYSGNSVLILKSKDGKEDFVIKISKSNELYHEYISYKFFYNLEYTTKPLAYFECGKQDTILIHIRILQNFSVKN